MIHNTYLQFKLRKIRPCLNFFRLWWIIYDFVHRKSSSCSRKKLTFSYELVPIYIYIYIYIFKREKERKKERERGAGTIEFGCPLLYPLASTRARRSATRANPVDSLAHTRGEPACGTQGLIKILMVHSHFYNTSLLTRYLIRNKCIYIPWSKNLAPIVKLGHYPYNSHTQFAWDL